MFKFVQRVIQEKIACMNCGRQLKYCPTCGCRSEENMCVGTAEDKSMGIKCSACGSILYHCPGCGELSVRIGLL